MCKAGKDDCEVQDLMTGAIDIEASRVQFLGNLAYVSRPIW